MCSVVRYLLARIRFEIRYLLWRLYFASGLFQVSWYPPPPLWIEYYFQTYLRNITYIELTCCRELARFAYHNLRRSEQWIQSAATCSHFASPKIHATYWVNTRSAPIFRYKWLLSSSDWLTRATNRLLEQPLRERTIFVNKLRFSQRMNLISVIGMPHCNKNNKWYRILDRETNNVISKHIGEYTDLFLYLWR